MPLTDEQLFELRKEVETFRISDLAALLARLDAAEAVARDADSWQGLTRGDSKILINAWREACGKEKRNWVR